jgi:D-alanine-D-alanine ligase
MNKKKDVTIIFGGQSAEHEVSLRSAAAVFRHLDPAQYTIQCIYINRDGQWKPVKSPLVSQAELNKGPFYSFLPWDQSISSPLKKTDIFFPVLHGPHGEDGTIQGIFEMAGAAYTGASALGSALAMDKAVAKILFKALGLPVGEFFVVRTHTWKNNPGNTVENIKRKFQLPVFVKPANLGSSVGISKIKNWNDLAAGLEEAFAHDDKVLIEAAVLGRELECSVLGNENPEASLPGEIIPDREFYDYRDKYIEGKTRFGIPAEIPDSLVKKIQALSIRAFLALECRGMARVDFFLEQPSGRLYLNEVNTIPGFTEISMYPKLWEVSGLPFNGLLDRLIILGLDSHSQRS